MRRRRTREEERKKGLDAEGEEEEKREKIENPGLNCSLTSQRLMRFQSVCVCPPGQADVTGKGERTRQTKQ